MIGRHVSLALLGVFALVGCTSLPKVTPLPAQYTQAPGTAGSVQLTTTDALTLFGQWWRPAGPPRAVVLLLHGMAAHGGFYHPWAQFLTAHGYAVFAYDQRGWGQSQGYGRRGYLRDYREYVDDVALAYAEIRQHYPDAPVFLQGESLGGAVALATEIDGGLGFQGLVLNAPGFQPRVSKLGWASDAGIWTGAQLGKVWPDFPLVPMGNRFLFKQIGKIIIFDPEVRRRALDDPHFTHSAVSAAFVTGLHAMSRDIRANFSKVKTPFLIINGDKDHLVPWGSGDRLIAGAAATDKTRLLYKGMSHCTLHDWGKEQVWADIVAWMEQRLPASGQQASAP